MADNETFEDIFNNWNVLASNWKNRKTIYRYQVEELLDNGEIPTQKAMPFLAAVYKEDVIFSKPNKLTYLRDNSICELDIAIKVLYKEKLYNTEFKGYSKDRGGHTPREKAKKETSNYYGISVREVEKYLSSSKERAKEILDKIEEFERIENLK